MDSRSEAQAIVAQIRRYIEDVRLFEGDEFVVPPGALEVEVPIAAPEAAASEAASIGAVEEPPVEEPPIRELPIQEPPTAAEGPELVPDEDLAAFEQRICTCEQCPLAAGRSRFVFGEGDPQAGIMFIGEAPGADEDRSGRPFVGAAGQLLDKIIAAMGLQRQQVYICNIVKCRPPNNRNPEPAEVDQCLPYLKKQIEMVQPRVICLLGRVAAGALLGSEESIGRLRGRFLHYGEIPVRVTYHPAALLRNQQYKRPVWEDVKEVRRQYDGVEL